MKLAATCLHALIVDDVEIVIHAALDRMVSLSWERTRLLSISRAARSFACWGTGAQPGFFLYLPKPPPATGGAVCVDQHPQATAFLIPNFESMLSALL